MRPIKKIIKIKIKFINDSWLLKIKNKIKINNPPLIGVFFALLIKVLCNNSLVFDISIFFFIKYSFKI